MAATTTLSQYHTDDDVYNDQRESSALLEAHESHTIQRTQASLRRDIVPSARALDGQPRALRVDAQTLLLSGYPRPAHR